MTLIVSENTKIFIFFNDRENEEITLSQMITAVDLDIEQTEYLVDEMNKSISGLKYK